MPPTDLLKPFLDPAAPKRARLAAARGMAPLPPREALELLVQLSQDLDGEIASHAAATLKSISEDELLAQVKSGHCSVAVLEYAASSSPSDAVLEAVIVNPETPAPVVDSLARRVPARLVDVILYDKARILANPEILVSAKLNPSIGAEAQRIILEIESEFFGQKNTSYAVTTVGETTGAAAPFDGEELALDGLTALEGLPADPVEREAALIERLSRMTVPEKLRQAMVGTREVRAVLIRDSNKEVARSVIRSPKLSEREVESFASMRNLSEDVLREIGNSRHWTRNHMVVSNLVKNPKTPALISQRLLERLQQREVAAVSRDRGLPEAVRKNAQRLLARRNASRAAGH
jgi:hypothetical protein